jgi:hypothetical protein
MDVDEIGCIYDYGIVAKNIYVIELWELRW